MHAFVGGVANEFEDVFALHGVAAGEDEDGNVHVGDLVDEGFAFGVAELVGMGDGLGGGAAMFTGKVTGLSDFPDSEEGRFVEVQTAAGGNSVHRLHETSCGIMTGRRGKASAQPRG